MNSKESFLVSWRPTSSQEYLLQASLLKGAPAEQAFKRWKESVDLDHLDYESFRLVPLLWKNLSEAVLDPCMTKLKGIYRAAWTKNQLQIGRALPLLKLFSDEGIEFILLKGVCLADQYYKDPGIRPFEDVDVMVPYESARRAVDLLLSGGWKPVNPLELPFDIRRHAMNVADKDGYNIDLHWQLTWCIRGVSASKPFWDDSLSVTFQGLAARVLCSSDLLLHVLVHGARIGSGYGLHVLPYKATHWVSDAFVVIQGGSVDWEKFCARAERFFVRLQAGRALQYLEELFPDLAVPQWVRLRLLKRPVQLAERFHYDATMEPVPTRPIFRAQKIYWNRFLSWCWEYAGCDHLNAIKWHQYPGLFLKYLQSAYQLQSPWLVPFRMARAFLKIPWKTVS